MPSPQVLASYNNDLPMLLRRQWGRGQVLFLTTSLSPEWTTLHDLPQSAWLMDHIARCVLSETLTAWNVDSEKGLVLPIALGEHGARFTLIDPDGKQQALSVDALGGDRYGIGLNDLTRRGIYRVQAERNDGSQAQFGRGRRWCLALGNPLGRERAGRGVATRSGAERARSRPRALWMPRHRPIPRARAVEGVDLWKWLIGLMLALLLAELLLAARSTSRVEAPHEPQQTIYQWLGRMLGLEQMQSVADFKFSFAASWAQRAPLLLFFGFVGLVAAAALFYFRHQPSRHPPLAGRAVSAAGRRALPGAVLAGRTDSHAHDPEQETSRPVAVVRRHRQHEYRRRPAARSPRRHRQGRRHRFATANDPHALPGGEGEPTRPSRLSRIEYLRALCRRRTKTCWNC